MRQSNTQNTQIPKTETKDKTKKVTKNMITNIHIRVSWKIFMDRLYHT